MTYSKRTFKFSADGIPPVDKEMWDRLSEAAKAYIVNKAYPEIDVSEAFGKKLDELAAIPVLSAFEIAEVMAKFGYTESEAKRYLIKQSTTHK